MIAIAGMATTIADAFLDLIEGKDEHQPFRLPEPPLAADRYLILVGYLAGQAIGHMSVEQRSRTWEANFALQAETIDLILEKHTTARICVIGSDSGFTGSFDMAYAGAKAAMHLYIETKHLWAPGQQLVGIAPSIIMDSGMTQRRRSLDGLTARLEKHPKERFLSAAEVAKLAHFLLYEDQGYISGTVIRMHGGERK